MFPSLLYLELEAFQQWNQITGKSSHYNYQNTNYYYDSDAFLVFEPGVDVEFNIVKFFRIAIGASYRLTNGINLRYKYLDNNFK